MAWRAPFAPGVSVHGEVGKVIQERRFCRVWEQTRRGWVGKSMSLVWVHRPTEGGILDDIFEEGNIGFHAPDAEFAKGSVHPLAGRFKIATTGGEFHQHGIVVGRDDRPSCPHFRIEANAESGGGAIVRDSSVVGGEALGRIFGGDAALNGIAVAGNLILRGDTDFLIVQFLATGDENLGTNQIDPGDALGHGVLDLNAWVHFDKEPFFGIHVVEELHGARIVVADIACKAGGRFAKFFTRLPGRSMDGAISTTF